MQCRVTNRIIPVMRNTTKEERVEKVLEVMVEMEDLVEVEDKLFVTIAEHLDTTHETVPILPLHFSIVSFIIILFNIFLFC